jgi:hypothetical protein
MIASPDKLNTRIVAVFAVTICKEISLYLSTAAHPHSVDCLFGMIKHNYGKIRMWLTESHIFIMSNNKNSGFL